MPVTGKHGSYPDPISSTGTDRKNETAGLNIFSQGCDLGVALLISEQIDMVSSCSHVPP